MPICKKCNIQKKADAFEGQMLSAYLTAALAEKDDSGRPFYEAHSIADFSPYAKKKALKFIRLFIAKAGYLLGGLDPVQLGTDFYNTHNNIGGGFGGDDSVNEELHRIAQGRSFPIVTVQQSRILEFV